MHRLLVPSSTLSLARATLPPAAARHLKVLRPKPGEEIELFDGQGRMRTYAYSAAGLEAAGEKRLVPPPSVRLTLFACVTKGSRWDWTIEKAVELGVARCGFKLRPGDLNGSGAVTDDDAIWLLMYTFFPEEYPIA